LFLKSEQRVAVAFVNLVGYDGVVGQVYNDFMGLMVYTGYEKGSAMWDFCGGRVFEP
jgi:hypothetical protein